MKTTFVFCWNIVLVLFLSFAISDSCVHAQGVLLRSIGAVNDSIGSVATATPIDAAGAIYWNPASISGLEKSEISFGIGVIMPKTRVSSSVDFPNGAKLSGSTKGNAGSIPDPSMAFVWRRCPKSPITFGLGLGAVGGAASLYPATGSPYDNPVLGGRAKSSTVIIMQVTPTVAYKVTDRFSVGIAPIIDLASLSINPMQLGQPLGSQYEVHNFGTRYAWGGGFQIGTYYDFKNHFKAGFMFKSPIWAEKLTYQGTRADGNNTVFNDNFDLNLPTTLSLGFSYDGIQDTIIGLDIRYFDYAHTAGFKKGIENGVVRGLDWDSVMAVAVGIERKFSQKLKLRMGYCWNENPIPDRSVMLNVAAPLMMQHVLSMGATYAVVKNLEFSFSYIHAFKAKITGPFPTGNSAAPYGSVTSEVSANMISAGITKKW
ncbi:MAG: outer membrane protein transport protein [Planctomycetaceae bacterium]|jgi:long-chain fatty acid transport protein|nr:outer membrane protein transport protein [Planctomycetaceae bacterium]